MRFPRTLSVLATSLLTILAVTAQAGPALSTADPDAIEEDWVLVIENPDPVGVGPQITTVMSPVADDSAPFVAFDLNYREYPSFSAGGMQLQVWSGKKVLNWASQGNSLFYNANETITWTQRMSVSNGTLTYDVANGQAPYWGSFGQGANLEVTFPTTLTSLAGYQPQVSANRSGATWQANHVTSLTLKQVRYYSNGVCVSTDTNPRVIVDNTGSTN